jgi:hypothetical protein
MHRLLLLPLSVGMMLTIGASGLAQPGSMNAQITYEVVINGETFQIEGNRTTKLQSKEKPGTTYEIAVRISPVQKLRLNTVQLQYDLPAKVTDDRGKDQRAVKIQHELGFSVLITDLGVRLEPKAQAEVLKAVTDSLKASYDEQKAGRVEVTAIPARKFGEAGGAGNKLHYYDEKGFGHTCVAYVLSGEKFSVTCVAQFLENDRAEVVPLIRKILESLRPLP